MKAIRNAAIVALMAATPLAFAHRDGGERAAGGCQGMQPSAGGMQERHVERHARMESMHQGMEHGTAPRFGREPKPEAKK
jgi:hypothetical protein